MTYEKLLETAKNVKQFAYSPYYKFKVGAALLTKKGNVYDGCNIENKAGFSVCAERVAVGKAISKGEKEFIAIAIVSDTEDYAYPCGVCRQFLMEFNKNLDVVVTDKAGYKVMKLKDLLPNSF